MRYPRMSANAKLTIGTMPSHVVCTGEGWDNLTVSKRRRRGSNPVKRTAADRVKASANTEPSVALLDKVTAKRAEWAACAPGPEKKKLMSQLRVLEMRAGIRDKQGTAVALDYMGETWASKQD